MELNNLTKNATNRSFPVTSFDSVKFINRFNPETLTKLDLRLIECEHRIEYCDSESCESTKKDKLTQILSIFKRLTSFGPITDSNLPVIEMFLTITNVSEFSELVYILPEISVLYSRSRQMNNLIKLTGRLRSKTVLVECDKNPEFNKNYIAFLQFYEQIILDGGPYDKLIVSGLPLTSFPPRQGLPCSVRELGRA